MNFQNILYLLTVTVVSAVANVEVGQVFGADSLSVLPACALDRQPESFNHFPGPQYAVVWRNWNLVPLERLAETLKTSQENILETAKLLGLPEYKQPVWKTKQIYITVLRRNWHLLPYEQILELIDQTPEQLAFNLREDDFLYHKLGNMKPVCSPVYWSKPTTDELERLCSIRKTVIDSFPSNLTNGRLTNEGEAPRFGVIDELKQRDPNFRLPENSQSRFALRYIYSYFALFGDPLYDESAEIFPDGLLEKLAMSGVNGVWLHVVLRDLAPGTDAFPELGVGHEKRIENLRKLVERCKEFGIDIYLYMNEPRSMPISFFEKHPNAKGVKEGNFCAMCTSDPDVRIWLGDSLAFLFREVPGLGGIFTITGSENLTYCGSHGRQGECSKCSKRNYDELVADVNAIMEEGVHRSAPSAKVLVWDWGWHGHGVTPEIIARLPKNVWLMSVSEWALPLKRGGISTTVGEYSISAVGPGPRASSQWSSARKAGLKTAAKCQFNVTWEIASIPYVPALELVAQHARNLAQSSVDGIMFSWSLGGHPSPNLQIPMYFDADPLPTVDEALDALAEKRFGTSAAKDAREGWQLCSKAYAEFPYNGATMYLAPTQIGPANLFRPQKSGYTATMVGIPYDHLDGWRGPFPPEVFARQMEIMAKGFNCGADKLQQAVNKITSPTDEQLKDCLNDVRYARVCAIIFGSVANQTRFVLLRDEYLREGTTEARRSVIAGKINTIIDAELQLTKAMFELTREDSRIGFESTNHYWFVPIDLVEKVLNLEQMKNVFQVTDK